MKKIAIFDVDNVLIKGQSQEEFLKFLLKKRVISKLFFFTLSIKLFLYKINFIRDISSIRLEAYKFFENKDVREIEKYFDNFFQCYLKKKINLKIYEVLNRHKDEGYIIVLISASLNGLVSRLGKYLNADKIISTNLNESNGKYTGRINNKVPYGKEKLNLFLEYCRNEEIHDFTTVVFADHYSDYDLLNFADEAVVVNPDSSLRKIAIKNKWLIYDFI